MCIGGLVPERGSWPKVETGQSGRHYPGQGLHTAQAAARPNQGHFAQDEPFVSKDKETVGWLECFYIIHFHTLE